MEYISYLYTYIQCESLQQLALYTQPAQLLSLDPSLQLLAPGQTNPQGHSPIPVDGADHYTQTHTQVFMTLWSHSRPPVLSPLETQRCSHTQSWPSDTHTQSLIPGHFLLAHSALSSLVITHSLVHLQSLPSLAPQTPYTHVYME